MRARACALAALMLVASAQARGDEIERLAGALRFPTVSHQDPAKLDRGAFRPIQSVGLPLKTCAPSLSRRTMSDTFEALAPRVGVGARTALRLRWLTWPLLSLGSRPIRPPGTDTKHFVALAEQSYRFTPIRAAQGDLARIHGTDERIAIESYRDAIEVYVALLRSL